jgi:prepilin-type N-terminal cleavage/methylation domain-containing protein
MMRINNRDPNGFRERGWSLIEVMAAIVVIGIGITLFAKVQKMASQQSNTNSKMLMAGKLIEKYLEDTRINIAQNPIANWPPANKTISPVPPDYITLVSTISNALSPVDGIAVTNVKRVDIKASWNKPYADSLKITTYVSKQF